MIAALLLSFVPMLAPAPVVQSAAATPPVAQSAPLIGVVRDSSGGAIAGAVLIARTSAGNEQRTLTGPDGRFSIALPPPFDLTVLAGGFAEHKRSIAVGGRDPIEIVLRPAVLREVVTVTPTRSEQRSGDVPASVNVLTRDEIRQSPAVVADDVLKQIPTFSLFTRLSSLAAHPTAQGVSLRGIGPSGVSRTLVLLDGVPFNDPLGGWVYWTRIPLESAEHIEMVDGTSSSLYGNYAMGGVINILSARPTKQTVEFKSQYGNLGSPKVDFRASDVWGKLGVSVDGSAFDTNGFPLVAPSERGPVDNNAMVKFHNFSGKADYAASDRVHLFARAGYFHEDRANGKITSIDQVEEGNNTTWKSASGGVRVQLPDGSDLQASIFTDSERFFSNFLAVPAPPAGQPARSVARVSLNQTVPTKGVGGMAQWSRAFMGKQVLSVGADWRWVEGESQEIAMDATKGQTPITSRFSGGDQRLVGAFVQDVITPMPKLEVTLSARFDQWRNYNPHNLETTIATGLATANNKPACSTSGGVPPTCLADRSDSVGSPRAAALYHLTDRVSAWGDFGYGFRAPTLNELYRQFSKGAVLTKPNDQLGPERLKGGELGVTIDPAPNTTVRLTWFDNRVRNPVSNVSQNKAQTLIQRQNLGRTRIYGLQSDVEYRLGTSWKVAAAYVYDQAKVLEFTTDPALGLSSIVGNFLPQVPQHRGSFRVAYSNPKYITATLGVQVSGRQFNDDQNVQFVPAPALADAGYPADASTVANPGLPKITTVDVTAMRDLGRNLQVYFNAQNLFDHQFFTALLPTTIGEPRMVSAGFRVRWMGK
jgi:outer membrane receptor protein involved in Fe transport